MYDIYDLKCLIEECQEALESACNKARNIYSDTLTYESITEYDEDGKPYLYEKTTGGWDEMQTLLLNLDSLENLLKTVIKPMESTFKSAEEDYKNQPDYDNEY